MNDICPRCGVIRELRMETGESREKDKSGKEQKITVKSYFCTTCNIFIKSEETIELITEN